MLNENATQEFDPYASANNPTVQTYDFFGKVDLSAWAGALVKGQGRVPFNKDDPNHKRLTMVDIFIQPLPEIDVKYPKSLEDHLVAEFPEWAKITLPSIKALGIDNVREVNGRYVRVARVPNGKKYEKKDKDGNLTGQFADETTFKFVALYSSEDECRNAALAAGAFDPSKSNGNGHNVPTPIVSAEDGERATAYQFLKVIVTNNAKGKATFAEAKDAVAQALTQYPTVSKFYTVDDIETGQIITDATGLLPF